MKSTCEGRKMEKKLIEKFKELYGDAEGICGYFAPGRVNLIGEHTDYNGGHVFPCALTLGTYGLVRKRDDKVLNFYSMNFEELGVMTGTLGELLPEPADGWTNYPKGVIWAFDKRGFDTPSGLDILIYGNIPNGSGLSSSASLEVLTGLMLKDLFGFEVSMTEIALIAQDAENNFNGMNCGIMDQFASAMGKKDHAIFLDTSTLHYEYAPIVLENAKIVIVNSKVKHSLVDSAYNERRVQCEDALAELQKVVEIQSLGELSESEFEKHKHAITSTVGQRRAKHAVYENQRAIQAVQALKAGDVATFGKLMNASHVSLRDDYEVSCPEVDILVETAWNTKGVIGGRITGGGFGGCTVNIVENDAVDTFIKTVGEEYLKKVGHEAEFYVVDVGDGASAIEL